MLAWRFADSKQTVVLMGKANNSHAHGAIGRLTVFMVYNSKLSDDQVHVENLLLPQWFPPRE